MILKADIGGPGDVVGPAGATDGEIALFDTASGKLLKDGAGAAAKLAGIEAAADVTDAANVAAAGAVMDSDVAEAEGMLRKTGAGAYEAIKTNLGSAVAPAVGDDSDDGYAVGSIWIDTTADRAYVCLDATVGSAVWTETTQAGGSGDVVGPAGATDEGIARYDLATGKLLKDSNVGINDVGDMTWSHPTGPVVMNRDSTTLIPVFCPTKGNLLSGYGGDTTKLYITGDGVVFFTFESSQATSSKNLRMSKSSAPQLMNEDISATNPAVCPSRSSFVNGVGGSNGTNLSLIYNEVSVFIWNETELEIGDGVDVVLNGTTGTKWGTATTQKQAWWNATPVVQPIHIADPAGGGTVDTECRAAVALILADLATLGLQAAA